MFSAYTIKKILPRLLIAAIMIQLSWWVTIQVIDINNDIAHGLEGLVYAPFGGMSSIDLVTLVKKAGNLDQLAATSIFATLAASGAFFVAGSSSIVGILALAVTAVLGVLIALFTLVLRRAVLLLLIVIAPLAIVAWVLPGTERFWKLWWESFTKLLLMYPLILLMIAAGRIFAYVGSSGSNQMLNFMIVILGFFGPLFMIPATLKLAGAAFTTLTSAVNSRNKGVFDRLRNVRAGEAKKVQEKSKNYSRLSDRNKFSRGLKTAAGAVSNPRDILGGPNKIRAGAIAGRKLQGMNEAKADGTTQAFAGDDAFWLSVANQGLAQQKIDEQKARMHDSSLTSDEQLAARMEYNTRTNAMNAAKRVPSRNSSGTKLHALNELAKTGYQFSTGEEGYNELSDTVRSITGNDDGAYGAAMNEAQYHLKTAQRFDQAGINHGAGYSLQGGLKKAGLYELANAKTDSIKAWGAGGADFVGPMTKTQMDTAAVQYKELEAMLPNTKDANRDEVIRQMGKLEDRGIKDHMDTQPSGRVDGAGNPITVEDRIPFNATLAQTDAGYAAGFTTAEQRAGYRMSAPRPERVGEAAQREARNYERPDPNRM